MDPQTGEPIDQNDPRLTPEYYAYYYSLRPLDPRLPRPLLNWSRCKCIHIFFVFVFVFVFVFCFFCFN